MGRTGKTSAACASPPGENAVTVRLGGQAVEVCCEECAVKLREAHTAGQARA